MSVFRLVFRLDFVPAFDIFDRPGKIMRTLLKPQIGGETFLPDLLEDSNKHAIIAQYQNTDKGEGRSFTVEPICIHGSFESLTGIEPDRLSQHDIFHKFIKIVNTIRQEFDINDLKRCGLRFYNFETVGTKECSAVQKFKQLTDNTFVDTVEGFLGGVTDAGLAFDGCSEENLQYHFKCGPYSTEGRDKYFHDLQRQFDDLSRHDVIFDIDIFEKDFRLNKEVSFAKWCNPVIETVSKVMTEALNRLTQKAG